MVTAAVAFFLFPLFETPWNSVPHGHSALGMALAVGIWVAALTTVGVWPTALWWLKRWPLTFTDAVLVGLVFANAPLILVMTLGGGVGAMGFFPALLFASLLGLAGGTMFWLIVAPLRSSRFA